MISIDLLIAALENAKVSCCVVGGYAVALHGAIRGTVDIDLVIKHTQQQFIACEKALRTLGLVPRLPVTAKEVFQFRQEYISKRNLIAWSFIHPHDPLTVVDIIITHDLSTMRIVSKNFGHTRIPVLALQDLIKMKNAAGRPQDIEDVKMLKELLREQVRIKKSSAKSKK